MVLWSGFVTGCVRWNASWAQTRDAFSREIPCVCYNFYDFILLKNALELKL